MLGWVCRGTTEVDDVRGVLEDNWVHYVRCVYRVMTGEIMLEGVCRSVMTG